MKAFRQVNWLDLTDVLEFRQVDVKDTYSSHVDGVNLIYDEETDTVFTVGTASWPPTQAAAETLDQYGPGEL